MEWGMSSLRLGGRGGAVCEGRALEGGMSSLRLGGRGGAFLEGSGLEGCVSSLGGRGGLAGCGEGAVWSLGSGMGGRVLMVALRCGKLGERGIAALRCWWEGLCRSLGGRGGNS